VLIHAIAHIEFNAINLALDAIWRFDGMPPAYYHDWLRVAAEEAKHFRCCAPPAPAHGQDYGDFPAHQGLWTMCEKTQHDIVARMALVPRTWKRAGWTPRRRSRTSCAGGHARCAGGRDILDIILRDEVGHVAIGNHWYRWLCEREAGPRDALRRPGAAIRSPRLKPPFNDPAAAQASPKPNFNGCSRAERNARELGAP
jgi:uncharacterized ferritin-like protein (DUF455 family)